MLATVIGVLTAFAVIPRVAGGGLSALLTLTAAVCWHLARTPRRLASDERLRLSAGARSHSNNATICYRHNDPEAENFAETLRDAMEDADWGVDTLDIFDKRLHGITIEWWDRDAFASSAEGLASAFRKAGISPVRVYEASSGNGPPSRITVYVGPK